MSFNEWLGKAAQKLQGNGYAKDIGLPTLMFDLASITSNDKSWAGDIANTAGNLFRTSLMATTFVPRKAATALVDKVLLPTAMLSYETGGRYLRQPLSAALTTLATGDAKKAWENKEEISPGQALSYLQSMLPGTIGKDEFGPNFDIFNPNDRKVFQEDWSAKTLSGSYDTFFTIVTDPLGKIGKAVGLARKALVTRPMGAVDTNAAQLSKDFFMPRTLRNVRIISPQTLANNIDAGRLEGGELYTTFSWMAKSDRVTISQHPMIQASNDGDTLAYLLGEAQTVDDVADTFVVAAKLGTTGPNGTIAQAAARLADKRRDLAFVLDKISDTTSLDKQVLDNIPTNGIVDDVNKLDAASALITRLEADPYYRMLTSFESRAADISRRTFGKPVFEKLSISRAEKKAARIKGIDQPTSFPTVGIIQPTKYHPTIAVVNFGLRKVGDAFQEKPAGYINFNDSDSFKEITSFGELLRRIVGKEIAQPIIDEHTSAYLRAGGLPELRSTVTVSLEEQATSAIHRKLGISDEQGAMLWGAYTSRRKTALDTIRNRKFLMTNDDVILKIPYLERQGANALPMVDLENYYRVLEKNLPILKGMGRLDQITDPDTLKFVGGMLNDMWKASVLLRLGYTIRNVSEGVLSVLGRGFGLLALSDINREGFKAWYANRRQGVERLIDRRMVSTGQREDSLTIRRDFSDTQARMLATERAINEARANIIAYERLFLQGKLSPEETLDFLEASQYLTGQYFYHGSATPIRALDPNRPLAMSLSSDVAEQYADAAMPRISASEIYKRKTGRAYPMPRNIRVAPGAPIGTPEVAAQVSLRDFDEFVTPYLTGAYGNIQKAMRGIDGYKPEKIGEYGFTEQIKGLTRTIQRSTVEEPTTVYRLTRNTDYATGRVGDVIEEKAFTSTTKGLTPSLMSNFGMAPVFLTIRLPKNSSGLDIEKLYEALESAPHPLGLPRNVRGAGYAKAEKEVLLPGGIKFRIVANEGDGTIPQTALSDDLITSWRMSGSSGPYFTRVTVEAILPERAPVRQPSLSMQTIAADMRDGFINSVDNGNVVEVLNPQTGRWTTINPNTVSQDLLVTGEFRIRKPGNQGVVLNSKVYGEEVDLRTDNPKSPRLNLVDYPELKTILGIEKGVPRNRAAWEGKEKELLDWMRANGIAKVILPDNKANGRATVLVDPEMVDNFGQNPLAKLTERRLNAIKRQREMMGDEPRMFSIIENTIRNSGHTVNFSGDVPTEGISVAIRGATHSLPLSVARENPQAWIDSVSEHFEKNLNKFGQADHFGTWVEDIDGVPHIWAEPTNVIKSRTEAVKIGVERNQKAVADLAAIAKGDFDTAFISTGGTGDVKTTARFALGPGTKAGGSDVTARAEKFRQTLGGKSVTERAEELIGSIGGKTNYPAGGLVQLFREAADILSADKTTLNDLLTKLDARVIQEERLLAPKAIQGTGRRTEKLYDGTEVEIDDAFRGEPGKILLDRTDNTDSYRRFVDHPSQFFAAEHGNFVEDTLTPNMPDYYSGWANQLNTFFRSPDGRIDPLIEQMLNGTRPEEIVAWLRKPENVAYARRFNIDVPGIKVPTERLNAFIDAEDFVGDLYSAFNRYLPDAEMQTAFRAGQITETWLRNHLKNVTELPDIIGRIVPTSPQARNLVEATAKFIDRAFYFLGSLPETTLTRHPLARQVYRTEYKNQLDVALSRKRMNLQDPNANLTVDEINDLRRNVIEATRKEVNKTLFTIVRKSYAGEKMRYIMPFFNAWENTIRRWTGIATENPAVIARAGQAISALRNQPNVIDREGNPTTEFSYENQIVVPMPEGAIKTIEKIPGWGKGMADALRVTGTEVSIPIRSLDLWFQGEVLAGFGPIVAMPVNQLVKAKPDLEDIFTSSVLPVLPFGTQEGFLRQLLPPAAQKLASVTGQDELWSRTFNTVYRYELIRHNLGERETPPTLEEISKLTNDFYKVRILSNLVMPFAAQYDSPLSFYTQQYRKLQDVYGQDAETLFLQMYPEMSASLVSASYNPTGAQASQQAYANINKYKDLISQVGQSAPEMIGFLVNDPDGKYDFSEAVYAWQYGNSPVPGSTANFRERRDPAQLKRDANIKSGWIEFRKKMGYLDSQLFAQGYTSYNDSGAEELLLVKQLMVADLSNRNRDWQADYLSPDRGKWIYRMQAMRTMLSNQKWMADNGKKPVVQAMAVYLQVRGQIARELENRKAYGEASTLTAKANADLDGYWRSLVYKLTEASPEFEDFYNRFLQNDPVTLG